jgi:hypothetical protein
MTQEERLEGGGRQQASDAMVVLCWNSARRKFEGNGRGARVALCAHPTYIHTHTEQAEQLLAGLVLNNH